MKNYLTIKSCEVFGNIRLVTVLDLGSHTLCDNLKKLGINQRLRNKLDKYKAINGFCLNNKFNINLLLFLIWQIPSICQTCQERTVKLESS